MPLLCFSTRGDYSQGEKKEKFRYATTLVFIQCIINALFARICKSAPRLSVHFPSSLTFLGTLFFIYLIFISSTQWSSFSRAPGQTTHGAGSMQCALCPIWEPWCPVTLLCSTSTTPPRSVHPLHSLWLFSLLLWQFHPDVFMLNFEDVQNKWRRKL